MRLRTGIATVVSGFSLVVLASGLAGSGLSEVRGTNSRTATAATFRRLGDLPGGAFSSEANAVSADGFVVVGKSASSSSGEEAFRWTSAQGMVGLGLPNEAASSTASDVSADGSVVVGTAYHGGWFGVISPFRWTAGTGAVEFPSESFPFAAAAPALSADGSVVVGGQCQYSSFGAGSCRAYRWTPDGGMVGLGDPLLDSTATGVSADGSVVVGAVEVDEVGETPCDCLASGTCGAMHDAFRWTMGEGITTLGFPLLGCNGPAAGDVSSDGQVLLVGSWEEPLGDAFWAAGTGLVLLPDLPGGPNRTRAKALSGDGSVIVGNSWSASGAEAFVWDGVDGMRSLRALLVEQYGLDLTGWTLMSANGVSDDGQTIIGTGVNPDGHTEAWIATLPGLDSDGDGVIDFTDACDHSNVDATLSIAGCETGIANGVDADGCTLADALATACQLSIGSKVRGRFAACVARLAGDWRRAGRIDRDQEGRAVACAAGGRAEKRLLAPTLPFPVVITAP